MSGESPKQEQFGAPVDFMRIAIAFKRWRWVIAGACVLGAAAGVTSSKALVPPVFEAHSVIECDRCAGRDYGDRELATLQESVKLPRHLEMARQKFGLNATIENIGRDIDVNASMESRLIQITARAQSGELAAGITNVIVDEFLKTRFEIEKDKLEGRLRTLEVDRENARQAVVEARQLYDLFRKENNIADLPAERQAAIQEAARLRSESAVARSEHQAVLARARVLERAASKEPSTVVLPQRYDSPDAQRLAVLKTDLTTARARFTADHPRVLALAAEVEMLERKIAKSNGKVVTGPNPKWDIAQQTILQTTADQDAASMRESTYEQLAQSAAQAAARLSGIEGRASELLSNLQTAERHSAAIESDKKVAEDEARSPSTGLRILTAAQAPSTPIKSTRKIAALLGPILGCLATALLVALSELRGFRIHTASELAFWGQGPVLASSRWPTATNALDGLVSDIVSALRGVRGKTMLVGAGPREAALVHAVTDGIQKELRHEHEISQGSIDALSQLDNAGALRRALRDVDRIIVCVEAGRHSGVALRALVSKIARPQQMAFVLLDVRADLASLPDLVGDGDAFRNSSHESEYQPVAASQPFKDNQRDADCGKRPAAEISCDARTPKARNLSKNRASSC